MVNGDFFIIPEDYLRMLYDDLITILLVKLHVSKWVASLVIISSFLDLALYK